jgi:hypothetical protein
VADFLMGLKSFSCSWNSVNESAAGISRFFWQQKNLIFKVLSLSNSTVCGSMSTTSLGNYEFLAGGASLQTSSDKFQWRILATKCNMMII